MSETHSREAENLPWVTVFIDEQLEALDSPMKAQIQIDVALDERFGKFARYAYEDSRHHDSISTGRHARRTSLLRTAVRLTAKA